MKMPRKTSVCNLDQKVLLILLIITITDVLHCLHLVYLFAGMRNLFDMMVLPEVVEEKTKVFGDISYTFLETIPCYWSYL